MQNRSLIARAALAAVLGIATLGVNAADRVYKWVDAEGVVHYGQQPPAGGQAEAIKVQKGFSTVEPEATEQPSAEERQQAADAETCRVATENFEKLSSAGEVKRVDEYGETHTMTQEDKDAEKARAQAAMDRYCKPAAAESPTP